LPVKDAPVNEQNGSSCWKRALLLTFIALLAATIVQGQAEKKSKVTVIVIQDEAPCFSAKVVIRPRGGGSGSAKTKTNDEIVLETDISGKAVTQLAPGRYRITAVDSIQNKIPALAYFEIKEGQTKPLKIRLTLIYWDCSHVTCEL
jgi:hypothetical protein